MDTLHLIIVIAALALPAAWLVRGRSGADLRTMLPGSHRADRTFVSSTGRGAAPSPMSVVTEAVPPIETAPASLSDFVWRAAESLPASRREAMLSELRKTPPPPRAFHQLVSPDFVARASSADLAELVIGVPLVATRVLARTNSAFYGLQRPVGSVGQAITFLGLNSVRTICVQYMMEASFTTCAPALRQRFDQLWAGSALASELCQKLAHRLQLPEAGGLTTAVALSAMGHLAAATLMLRDGIAAPAQSLLTRSWCEQAQLGAPAAEIGALLMRAWDLPEPLVEEVRAIDRMLVTPPDALEPPQYLRLAVGYLSTRLGERMARGDTVNLSDFEQGVMGGDDLFHLRAGLSAAQQQRLKGALQAPDVTRSLRTMLAAIRQPEAF